MSRQVLVHSYLRGGREVAGGRGRWREVGEVLERTHLHHHQIVGLVLTPLEQFPHLARVSVSVRVRVRVP